MTPTSAPSPDRALFGGFVRVALWTLIGTGSFLRIASCVISNPLDHRVSDATRHWSNGENFWTPDLMGGYDPLGYQVFMWLLQSGTGGNRWGIGLACGLLSFLMPWLFYRAARELGVARDPSLLLFAVLAWMPSTFLIFHHFMMETLLLPMIGLSLWMTARHLRKGGLGAFLVATVCWTLTCLIKTVPVPLALFCLAYGWWRRSHRASHALAALVVVAALLVPNAIRSRQILGFYAPLGNAWLPVIHHRAGTKFIRIQHEGWFWRYSSPSCYIEPLEPLSHWRIERAANEDAVLVTVDPRHGVADWRDAHDKIQVSTRVWLGRWFENIVLFFFAPTWPSAEADSWEGWICHQQRWMWAPLIIGLLVANIRAFRKGMFHLIPMATMLFTLWLMAQNLVTMEGRFRLSVEPLLLLNLCWILSVANRGRRASSEEPSDASQKAVLRDPP